MSETENVGSSAQSPRYLFPLVFGLIGLGVLGGVYYATNGGRQGLGKAAAPAPAPAPAPAAPAPAPAAPAPEAAATADALKAQHEDLAKQVDELRTRVDTLKSRVDELKSRLDGLHKPEPSPDLKPITVKLDELGKLPERLTALDDRVGAAERAVAALGEGVDGLKGRIEKLQEARPAPAAAGPRPEPEASRLAGEDLAKVAGLVKGGQPAQARQAADDLGKLREQFPQDARVWYLSALANGYGTGKWTEGDTINFVNRAVELEKAGTPDRAAIDAALNGLEPNGARWISYFRNKAK